MANLPNLSDIQATSVDFPSPPHLSTAPVPFTFVEFFAGGGLARLGFGNGWTVRMANDICPKKAATYRRNFGGADLLTGDVARVRANAIPSADAWWVSFPCTDHSTAGLMGGFSDGKRGSAVFQVIKRLKAAKRLGTAPAVLAFENVVGFLSVEGAADFVLLLNQLASCQYRAGACVVDADRWLPQSRRRVFIIAVRNDVPVPDVCRSASPRPAWAPPVLKKAVSKLEPGALADWVWWDMPEPPDHATTLADIVEDVPEAAWSGLEAIERFLAMLDPPGRVRLQRMRDAGAPAFGTVVERTDPSTGIRISSMRAEVAFTLMATGTGSSRQRLIRIHGEETRIREYTPRELARLMGVADDYALPSDVTPAMGIMGDAVAVPVVRHLVRHLVEPLAQAARDHDRAKTVRRPAEDGRRPIKDRTTGTIVYLLPGEHEKVKAAAAKEGVSMLKWVFDAISARMAASGRPALVAYEPAARCAPATARVRSGVQPGRPKAGRLKAGRQGRAGEPGRDGATCSTGQALADGVPYGTSVGWGYTGGKAATL